MVDPHDQVDVDRADHDDLARGHTGYRPNSRVHRSSRKRSASTSRATVAFGSPHGSGMCQKSATVAPAVSSPPVSTETHSSWVLTRLGSMATATANGSWRAKPLIP